MKYVINIDVFFVADEEDRDYVATDILAAIRNCEGVDDVYTEAVEEL
jgi:hypothetical protein